MIEILIPGPKSRSTGSPSDKGAKEYAFWQILLVILMLTEVYNFFSNSFTLESLNFF